MDPQENFVTTRWCVAHVLRRYDSGLGAVEQNGVNSLVLASYKTT